MNGLLWEVGDLEYEVRVGRVHYGSPGTYWQPPETGEIELGNFVDVHVSPGLSDVTTWGAFVLALAADRGWSLDRADSEVHDRAFESALEEAYERESDCDE